MDYFWRDSLESLLSLVVRDNHRSRGGSLIPGIVLRADRNGVESSVLVGPQSGGQERDCERIGSVRSNGDSTSCKWKPFTTAPESSTSRKSVEKDSTSNTRAATAPAFSSG